VEGYEGVAALMRGVPPPNGGCAPGRTPVPALVARGREGDGGWDWGRVGGIFLKFRCPRALSDIEQGWGSKGEGLLPFTFGRVAENLRRFEYE
jgi:hypothetical protein